MRLPRVQFTVRWMMVAVAVSSLYSAVLRVNFLFGIILIVWTITPLLWTSLCAGWRRTAGDAMSGVEWVALFILSLILASPGMMMLVWFVETAFPVYSY